MNGRFADRTDAGRALAEALVDYRGHPDVVVLGLPRGGVPVAKVVADAIGAPLDVVVVRKVGTPGQAELAMGAIASIAGTIVTIKNASILRQLADSDAAFERVAARERVELERRQREYRADRGPLDVAGKTVLVVDDGIATGATMKAAVLALKKARADRIVVAVPVGPADTCEELESLVDRVVCVWLPDPFWAVWQGYVDFSQTSDDEVRRLLAG
ncbi:MAG: phosphoribosyltransferase [Terrimesophilobacter sp.]